ncbi:MAG: RHS repeat-associated core domain-containing protein, partial [Gallionella sp.]|nr:RHS repeat-associated core domain-containing protein [Gallionella sp.]
TDHGYTGHEHLDDMGLIHMNGRVYDPRTGRFLQADPTIQSPGNLQSFNRYSYVMNNPFFGTDPSGYDITFPGPTVTYTDGYGNPGTTTGPSVNIPCTCGLPPNMNLPGIANPNIPIITPLLSNVSNFLNNTTSQFMVGYNGKKSVTDDPLTNIGEIGQKTKDTLTFLNDVIVAAPVVGGVYTAVDAGLKADVGGLLFGLATIGVDLYTLDGRRSA